jgi:hypothetical protein
MATSSTGCYQHLSNHWQESDQCENKDAVEPLSASATALLTVALLFSPACWLTVLLPFSLRPPNFGGLAINREADMLKSIKAAEAIGRVKGIRAFSE